MDYQMPLLIHLTMFSPTIGLFWYKIQLLKLFLVIISKNYVGLSFF
jgi:hypothetical protein